jgi:hypothetical protein
MKQHTQNKRKSKQSIIFFGMPSLVWELSINSLNLYCSIFHPLLGFLFLFLLFHHLMLAEENRSGRNSPNNQTCQLERNDCQVSGAGWQFVSTSVSRHMWYHWKPGILGEGQFDVLSNSYAWTSGLLSLVCLCRLSRRAKHRQLSAYCADCSQMFAEWGCSDGYSRRETI